MTTRMRALVLATAAFGLLVAMAPHAAADPAGDAAAGLRSASLYVDPAATGFKLDRAKLTNAIPNGVKIAVLPTSAGSATTLARDIGETLDPNGAGLTVGVFTADASSYAIGAGSSAYCEGYAGEKAAAAANANRSEIKQTHDITNLLSDFAQNVKTGPKRGSSACGPAAGGGPSSDGKSDGSSAWPWVVGLGVAGAGGIGGLVWYRRRRRNQELALARSRVMPYYDRLANEVSTIEPGDDATARRAMADASERYASAGAQLDTADSVEKFAQARRTTLEGLYAAVTARKALGLDPGPDLPTIDEPRGDQLTEPREVTVGGSTYQGYPSYTPGAPYYYGGGYGVPGGWYATPFWEALLIGSVLSGGFGGWGGGGYGAGYQSGYEAGRDESHDDQGNWGDSGGDWGGGGYGGGDWGGGGGGGDSGGSW